MDLNLAYCGLSCELCPVRWKTLESDPEKKNKLISQIIRTTKEQYDFYLKPEEITDCDGCNAENSKIFPGCLNCAIRRCAKNKNIENCAYCDDYPCEKLIGFLKKNKEAKDRLDIINSVYK